MKQIVFAIAMALSLTSNASYMTHNYAQALAGISLDNACITDTEVRSIRGETACLEYSYTTVRDGDGSSYVQQSCTKIGKKMASNPRAYTTSVCSKYAQIGGQEAGYLQCVESKNVEGFLPATIAVTVVTGGGEADIERAGSFTFPTCK